MSETHVLVHGAWHGGWCWAAVQNQLSFQGDRSFAVDLPGHGQDETDRARITYNTYVNSVVRFIEERNLRDVILSGHSLGGLTVSGVTAAIPRRIKRAVFVTAFVLLDGERVVDVGGGDFQGLFESALSRPDKSLPIDPIAQVFRERFIQDAPRELQDFVLAAMCPQPVAPVLERIPMKAFYESGVPTGYVVCEDDQSLPPPGWHPRFSSRLKNPALKFIKCGHEVMFTQPAACAQALYELARS